MRDRTDVKIVTGVHAENIFEFLKVVVKELDNKKSKDLRCVYMYILQRNDYISC